MRPKSCCKGCEKREVGCHGKCADYISFRKELDAINEKKWEATQEKFWKVGKDLPLKKEVRRRTRRLIDDGR